MGGNKERIDEFDLGVAMSFLSHAFLIDQQQIPCKDTHKRSTKEKRLRRMKTRRKKKVKKVKRGKK